MSSNMSIRSRSQTFLRRLAFVIILVSVTCSTAEGHHIRGIPHYTYSENYPDAPKVDTVRVLDDVTLTMTYYEISGTTKVDLSLYVKNNRTGKVFDGEVIYAVYGKNEDPLKAHAVKALRNKNNMYKAGWVYHNKGLYFTRVTFEFGGRKINEVFPMQIGATEVNYWLLGLVGGSVLALIVVVAVIKKLQTSGRDATQ